MNPLSKHFFPLGSMVETKAALSSQIREQLFCLHSLNDCRSAIRSISIALATAANVGAVSKATNLVGCCCCVVSGKRRALPPFPVV